MADLLSDGASWLADQSQDHLSRTVTYRLGRPGATTITGVKATLGRKLLKTADQAGNIRMIRSQRDYIVVRDQLSTDPARGHQIVDAGDPDGVTRTWEVRSPGNNEPEWQWKDSHRRLVVVHCALVETP